MAFLLFVGLLYTLAFLLHEVLALGTTFLGLDVARTVKRGATGSREVQWQRERALAGFPFTGQERHRFWKPPIDPCVIDVNQAVVLEQDRNSDEEDVVSLSDASALHPEEIKLRQPPSASQQPLP